MRKGDSLSGASLSPTLTTSPTLEFSTLESPALGARAGHPWGLPDTSIVSGEFKSATVASVFKKNQKKKSKTHFTKRDLKEKRKKGLTQDLSSGH